MKRCSQCGEVKAVSEFYKQRITKDGLQYRCKKCQSVSAAKYRTENPEKHKAQHAKWLGKNLNYPAEYRAENADKVRAYIAKWQADNPEKTKAWAANRRARKLGADGDATAEQIAARWAVYGDTCYICGGPAEATDHVKPLAKGGSNWPANLRPICGQCNSSKGAIWPYDFAAAQVAAA